MVDVAKEDQSFNQVKDTTRTPSGSRGGVNRRKLFFKKKKNKVKTARCRSELVVYSINKRDGKFDQ